jgi:hypothetical protein
MDTIVAEDHPSMRIIFVDSMSENMKFIDNTSKTFNELFQLKLIDKSSKTSDIPKLIELDKFLRRIHQTNRRNNKASDLALDIDDWMVFLLPRRLSLLIYAIKYNEKSFKQSDLIDFSSQKFDTKKYKRQIYKIKHKQNKFIKNYLRNKLRVYRIVDGFRRITGDELLFPVQPITFEVDAPIVKYLKEFSTPTLVFKLISNFAYDKPISIGISYIRALEAFAYTLLMVNSLNELLNAINKFKSRVKYLDNLEYTNQPLSPVEDLDFSINENLENLVVKFSQSAVANLNLRKPRKLLRGLRGNEEKKWLLQLYQNFPTWIRIQTVLLQGSRPKPKLKKGGILKFLFKSKPEPEPPENPIVTKYGAIRMHLCYNGVSFVVASEVAKRYKRYLSGWKQSARYFEFADNLNAAKRIFDTLYYEYREQGYS